MKLFDDTLLRLCLHLFLVSYNVTVSRSQYTSRCDPARAKSSKCHERHQMDVYIASAGGTGSNFLYSFLCKQGFALGSRALDYGARWCHSVDPVTPDLATSQHIKRGIFLYSIDPLKQVESMYRQGYAEVNYRKKIGLPSKLKTATSFPLNFRQYCNKSLDLIALEAQWEQWVRVSLFSRVSFPILAIQFEKLWEHLPGLFRYVNLPLHLLSEFPKQKKRRSRGSSSTVESFHSQSEYGVPSLVNGCASIYKSLQHKIHNTSEFLIIWDGQSFQDVETFLKVYADPPRFSPPQRGCNDTTWDGGAPNYHLHIKS